MDFRCTNKVSDLLQNLTWVVKHLFLICREMFEHLSQRSVQNFTELQNGFWAVMSLILWWKIKWNGQRLTGTAPVCQPADISQRSIWQRGQWAKMKKTNVRVRVFPFSFFQTPIIQRRRRTNAGQGQQLFTLLNISAHRKLTRVV